MALADDRYLLREVIGQMRESEARVELVAVCSDGDEGITIAHRLRETHPDIGVVVRSQFSDHRYGVALPEHSSDARVRGGVPAAREPARISVVRALVVGAPLGTAHRRQGLVRGAGAGSASFDRLQRVSGNLTVEDGDDDERHGAQFQALRSPAARGRGR